MTEYQGLVGEKKNDRATYASLRFFQIGRIYFEQTLNRQYSITF